MELNVELIASVIGLLLGGGGIGGVITWKYARMKERGEARQAENQATKELQDIYQQLIADIKTDRDEQKSYISELKADRNNLRHDRDELRERQEKMEVEVAELKQAVARHGRMVEGLRPLLCGCMECPDRIPVDLADMKGTRKKRRGNENDK